MARETEITALWFQGEDKVLEFQVKDASGNVVDITGWTFEWVMYDRPGGTAVLTKTSSGGAISITDAANGEYQVTVPAADTLNLDAKAYYYRTWRTNAGNLSALAFGTLTLLTK